MKGVRINEAYLFVAANMPKETPQRTESTRVIVILETVLKVYSGRFFTSGYCTKVTISQAATERMTNPITNCAMYLCKSHAPA